MHMADALVSPAVGGSLWAVSAALIALCARRVRRAARENLVPMMGVLGAFVFSAQMINFSIPGTGSSGHLGGGLILAVLLGPYAAFLVIASVLTVQAFFFADGGLLALGCNIFNLGFFPAFVVYPLLFKPFLGEKPTSGQIGRAHV
jgi:cobalt/nickel transport system permease protein